MTIAEAAEEMRDIALTFFRGNSVEDRFGFIADKTLVRLEQLRAFLVDLSATTKPPLPSPEGGLLMEDTE